MKHAMWIVFVVATTLSSFLQANDLDNAVKYGNFLTEAVQSKQKVKLKKLPEYKAIKTYLATNKCPGFKYNAYVVGPEEQQYFYLVASKGGNVIIGRHFKARKVGGAIKVGEFESSTNGCLNLGNPKTKKSVAMFATHLKPTPNEFHLLQSNLHSIALYIGTSNGMYLIENESIELSEEE